MAMFIVECCNLFLLQSHLLMCRHGFCDVGVTLSKQTLEAQGGGVLLYFHAYVGSDHFFGVKFLNFNIFWGFQKNVYFFGYENFVDIFLGVIPKLD